MIFQIKWCKTTYFLLNEQERTKEKLEDCKDLFSPILYLAKPVFKVSLGHWDNQTEICILSK